MTTRPQIPGHREVHPQPASYRYLKRITIPAAGSVVTDIRDAGEADGCPWLDGSGGRHSSAQARSSAILKRVALRVLEAAPGSEDTVFLGDSTSQVVGDLDGLVSLTWPAIAGRRSFLVSSTAGAVVEVEVMFDILAVAPPGSGQSPIS